MYYCFGEVLWDTFKNEKVMGGAAFNVAAHLQQLGAEVLLISGLGSDEDGKNIVDIMHQKNMSTQHIHISSKHPTGVVNVLLDNNGIPSYDIVYPSAWDDIHFEGSKLENDTLIFGTLALRNSTSKNTFLKIKPQFGRRVFDINLRIPFYDKEIILEGLNDCDILKINDEELLLLSGYFDTTNNQIFDYLFNRFNIQIIIQTLGKQGAEIITKNNEKFRAHPPKIEVVDTVGCGDSFLAGFLYYFDSLGDIQTALNNATLLSAFVASKRGAVPDYEINNIII